MTLSLLSIYFVGLNRHVYRAINVRKAIIIFYLYYMCRCVRTHMNMTASIKAIFFIDVHLWKLYHLYQHNNESNVYGRCLIQCPGRMSGTFFSFIYSYAYADIFLLANFS